jgi:hypothetical protein
VSFLTILLRGFKLAPSDAEIIFDRSEPVGRPTDLVMRRRRWFRRSKGADDQRGGGIPNGARSNAAS